MAHSFREYVAAQHVILDRLEDVCAQAHTYSTDDDRWNELASLADAVMVESVQSEATQADVNSLSDDDLDAARELHQRMNDVGVHIRGAMKTLEGRLDSLATRQWVKESDPQFIDFES
ncbi:hypothetical protein [Timonella sp. A28]|uniref:hypothetical protein n=1 Tax=Timonella sp. A28 TaxID=3442640 RepID=UPI003EB9FCDC